jgi:hypothetical protein
MHHFLRYNWSGICRYYYNKVTKDSKWTIPEELKVCHKFVTSFFFSFWRGWGVCAEVLTLRCLLPVGS